MHTRIPFSMHLLLVLCDRLQMLMRRDFTNSATKKESHNTTTNIDTKRSARSAKWGNLLWKNVGRPRQKGLQKVCKGLHEKCQNLADLAARSARVFGAFHLWSWIR